MLIFSALVRDGKNTRKNTEKIAENLLKNCNEKSLNRLYIIQPLSTFQTKSSSELFHWKIGLFSRIGPPNRPEIPYGITSGEKKRSLESTRKCAIPQASKGL